MTVGVEAQKSLHGGALVPPAGIGRITTPTTDKGGTETQVPALEPRGWKEWIRALVHRRFFEKGIVIALGPQEARKPTGSCRRWTSP